jgi:hypothetical protein
VIHHSNSTERCLAEMTRVLRPRGRPVHPPRDARAPRTGLRQCPNKHRRAEGGTLPDSTVAPEGAAGAFDADALAGAVLGRTGFMLAAEAIPAVGGPPKNIVLEDGIAGLDCRDASLAGSGAADLHGALPRA